MNEFFRRNALWVILAVGIAGWFVAGSVAKSAPRAIPPTPQNLIQAAPKPPAGQEIATLAAGCFWSNQAMYQKLKGVSKVEPGYAGGHTPNPTYDEVCTDQTGYAESVQITFDPKVISYHDLLTVFFGAHDPTTLNRQGPDEGTQYRSAIFYQTPEQKATALQVKAEYQKSHPSMAPIVTQIGPFTNFYRAESYHYDYYAKHPDQPYCAAVVAPEIARFEERFHSRLK
ncbi:peptide methionine sulfoxide reductase MsrA [Capsulimonas corticalis]|uniref:Peptide methionine sulfoxide reductase MsrA n=1 Tax=Capsulimonas corticalis TaxID=2219043 RepID=A0A402CYX4_9BACT|nr:peptide-methionine (S)-S-oxide reductase MsrA [Capsulimonas corticalis]BDI29636.1 peptide methionine sulfoxide reductase MsrA [Capsulimonas corticalis]